MRNLEKIALKKRKLPIFKQYIRVKGGKKMKYLTNAQLENISGGCILTLGTFFRMINLFKRYYRKF